MAVNGSNEGFRVLDEFVCDAVPGPSLPLASSHALGANAGLLVVSPVHEFASNRSGGKELESELRRMSTSQIHGYLVVRGQNLTREELMLIHDIVIERLIQERNSDPTDAERLSRAVLEAALRIA